jgi:hypothetical protein
MPRVTVSDAEYKSWLAAVQDVPPRKGIKFVGTAFALSSTRTMPKNKDEAVEKVYSFVITPFRFDCGQVKESERVLICCKVGWWYWNEIY